MLLRLVVEPFLLCLGAPLLLSLIKNKRLALAALLLLGVFLVGLGVSHLSYGAAKKRMLAHRAWYQLEPSAANEYAATIHPIPGAEGIHVSVVDLPQGSLDLLRSASWTLDDPSRRPFDFTTWFDAQSLKFPDDGLPLFETGDRPLQNSVTIRAKANAETLPWLKALRLQVRPCWFTLKVHRPIANIFLFRATFCFVGAAIVVIAVALKVRKRAATIAAPSTC